MLPGRNKMRFSKKGMRPGRNEIAFQQEENAVWQEQNPVGR